MVWTRTLHRSITDGRTTRLLHLWSHVPLTSLTLKEIDDHPTRDLSSFDSFPLGVPNVPPKGHTRIDFPSDVYKSPGRPPSTSSRLVTHLQGDQHVTTLYALKVGSVPPFSEWFMTLVSQLWTLSGQTSYW